uniref:Uncharacterized protein n=1 Tax=Anguilla anguilla TaxID=7936 RepID=A0A0E9V6M1_ANGAN
MLLRLFQSLWNCTESNHYNAQSVRFHRLK